MKLEDRSGIDFKSNLSMKGAPIVGDVCVPNINAAERRKRLMFGIVAALISLAVLAALLAFGAGRGWRLVMLPLLWGSALGFFQWRDKTGVSLSARGARQLGDQVEQITDVAELTQVRRQAARVQLKAGLAAVLLTALVLILPFLPWHF